MNALAKIWLGAGLYAAVFFALGANRYQTYHSGADLGLFTQSIASVFHGFSNTVEGGSHFTVHFSPILYLCAPLLLATRSPLSVDRAGRDCGRLTGPPLFLFARRRMPENLALGVAVVGLLYPPLAGVDLRGLSRERLRSGVDALADLGGRCAPLPARRAVSRVVPGRQGRPKLDPGLRGALRLRRTLRARASPAGMRFAGAAFVLSLATFFAFFAVVRPLAGASEAWSPLHFYAWQDTAETGSTPWYSIGRPAYFLEALLPLAFVCLAVAALSAGLAGLCRVPVFARFGHLHDGPALRRAVDRLRAGVVCAGRGAARGAADAPRRFSRTRGGHLVAGESGLREPDALGTLPRRA